MRFVCGHFHQLCHTHIFSLSIIHYIFIERIWPAAQETVQIGGQSGGTVACAGFLLFSLSIYPPSSLFLYLLLPILFLCTFSWFFYRMLGGKFDWKYVENSIGHFTCTKNVINFCFTCFCLLCLFLFTWNWSGINNFFAIILLDSESNGCKPHRFERFVCVQF